MKACDVRQAFLDFFKGKGHTLVSSSPVVPQNDHTLLFVNAGMNQFKDVFLGTGSRSYQRAADAQVCIRVSGKHNDLEDVGLDTHHLTLFEMLGNWSFGDYYKKEAIMWAWELLTTIYKLPKDKLYASYYKTDQESADLWQKHTDINPKHILKFGEKENFWEMAETGPCGPCSEIHLDRGEQACDKKNQPNHLCQVNGDCARFIELWNLVFIQYNKKQDQTLEELPQKHVDTGAGLERISAYLQKTNSNFETDLFKPIIKKIEDLTGIPYQDNLAGMPHRVMADHIRTLTFAIADNVVPSNEGRGYVLRRILRRGLRYAKKLKTNLNKPILFELVDPVVEVMQDQYPHLKQRRDFIVNLIKAEEESFLRTLDSGLTVFNQLLKSAASKIISGQDAFKLYDTYGFPLDLTQILAKENNITVDLDGFQKALEEQRAKSRKHIKLHNADDERLSRGGEARVADSAEERLKLARHHTATHLLQAALRQVLGEHVAQAGSLVDLDYLRFDFSHFQALTKEQLHQVEELVNTAINKDYQIEIMQKGLKEAKQLGALALFGEKYEDQVRVVKIADYSLELCGGNHVSSTNQIEEFKILSESAISAGTRRIVAIAGKENIKHHFNQKQIKEAEAMKAKRLLEINREATEKQLAADKDKVVKEIIKPAEFREVLKSKNSKIELIIKKEDYDLQILRFIADSLLNLEKNLIVILGSDFEGKGLFYVKIGPQVTIDVSANDIIQKLTKISGGRGGGKKDAAQAGGADSAKIKEALASIKTELQNL